MNSQVPSKVFGGEGPQLAWGEESAKRSGRVCAVPQGENVLDASMMAELIVTKKEIGPQIKKSTGNFAGHAEKPRSEWSTIAVSGETLRRAFDSLVPGFEGGLGGGGPLPQLGRRLKRRSGRTRRRGHWSFKAICKNGGAGSASGAGTPASTWLVGHRCNLRVGWVTITPVCNLNLQTSTDRYPAFQSAAIKTPCFEE